MDINEFSTAGDDDQITCPILCLSKFQVHEDVCPQQHMYQDHDINQGSTKTKVKIKKKKEKGASCALHFDFVGSPLSKKQHWIKFHSQKFIMPQIADSLSEIHYSTKTP